MKITYDDIFTERLKVHLEYISNENPNAANRIKRTIISQIKTIPKFPYSFRKSIFFENDNIRDLIVFECTVVFEISENNIHVFGFRKNQNEVI